MHPRSHLLHCPCCCTELPPLAPTDAALSFVAHRFPITCDIINTICNKVGVQPLRIVMVRKRGIQALVEFDSVAAATNVKEQLNFQDIYKGCCTLKIECVNPAHPLTSTASSSQPHKFILVSRVTLVTPPLVREWRERCHSRAFWRSHNHSGANVATPALSLAACLRGVRVCSESQDV